MKKLLFLFLLLLPASIFSQPDLISIQQSWIDSLKTGQSLSSFYWESRNLTYTRITTSDSESLIQLSRSEQIKGLGSYEHIQTFKHDKYRFITVGTLDNNTESMILLTGWRDVDGSWKKEIDLILTHEADLFELDEEISNSLNDRRFDWVKLANQHDPQQHIKALYTADAMYFSNGQKSEGREQIIDRYAYMENPNYQVDLEKEQLWHVSKGQVLEIGRYFTGAERVGNGGLYVILWENVKNQWMIELDFNF
ncbi:MAG: hypothetical protein RI564_08435 [Gracilimonas sp.]|nr:hypothetical protein [Gracilimonas sp.]